MPRPRAALRALAERLGIVAEYLDQTGAETRVTSDATRVALLAALGVDAASEAAARHALDALEAEERERPLAPAAVVREGERAAVRLPEGWAGAVEWALELRAEGGTVHRAEGRARAGARGALRLEVPTEAGPGYHTLRVTLRRAGRGGGEERHAEQSLVVSPARCPTPHELLGGRRAFGLIANLYTVRSARNWGVGDVTDLRALLEWAAETGGAFVGVNPLHALTNRGQGVSPYSPVSRLFRNPLYLDVEAVPELAELPSARERLEAAELRDELRRLRDGDRVEYEEVMAIKRMVLEALFGAFVQRRRGRDTARGRAFAEYADAQGPALTQFATWSAIAEHLAERQPDVADDWREWPPRLRDARSAEVRAFRESHRDEVDFHRWLQFELDRQLGAAARRGREAGLPIGLYQDLAIGTAPSGADTWMHPQLFVEGVSIGAPPDQYSKSGQYWGLPPINPRQLAADGFRYWIALLRSSLRHAGALRMDHVLGLFRQFWVPEGKTGKDGAYVQFPTEALLGILALESSRAGALVVGEDLGTVPEEVPGALKRWGILSSKVLYFERDARGYKPASAYEPLALTTANTHDMATLAGHWRGRDIELKEQVGLLSGREAKRAREERVRERADLVRRLAAEGLLPDGAEPATTLELRALAHAFLRRTPSLLVGLALDDVAGEVEPVNVPGVGPDQFPSWTRRMGRTIEELRRAADARRAMGAEREWVAADQGPVAGDQWSVTSPAAGVSAGVSAPMPFTDTGTGTDHWARN